MTRRIVSQAYRCCYNSTTHINSARSRREELVETMSAAAAIKDSRSGTPPGETPANAQGIRETVESIIVAFILAFLFRAFVAEAFVIPTGSMAPTLMGAHKDIFCEHCGQQYQASASSEFDSNTGALKGHVTVASTCSTCRGLNAYDLRGNSNHASFSGDRILVSKFDYILSDPQRWDVFVFKYPTEARMNYIKRLIGLPGESLLIQDGDIYTKSAGSAQFTIARKPPKKIRAMRQIVSDTKYQAPILINRGWPSLWQPLPAEEGATNWKVSQNEQSWSAELPSSTGKHWLRYYHKFLDDAGWQQILSGGELDVVDPYSSKLITDYLAYNSYYQWWRDRLYNGRSLKPEIDGDTSALELAMWQGLRLDNSSAREGDGYHWVGDLAGEFEIEIASDAGTLLLDLVEFGIHYQCSIDVADGKAMLAAQGPDGSQTFLDGDSTLKAQTSVRGPGKYRVEFANFDDQLVLWVDRSLVEFNKPAVFDSRQFRDGAARRPYWTETDPLDAAPIGIGGENLALNVTRAMVYRDIYYIAIQGGPSALQYSDYQLGRMAPLVSALPDAADRDRAISPGEVISAVYSHPRWWSETNLFSQRGSLGFQLEEDQYFPMGDNSSHSSDARAWIGHNYVEKKYLLGKALLVFWPHTWNSPVPFTPNFSRMGLIR